MKSPTYGDVDLSTIASILCEKSKNSDSARVLVGTDSQNFDKTKVVEVIAFHDVGHGGIFFYRISTIPVIRNVKQKIIHETSLSLNLMEELKSALELHKSLTGFDYTKHLDFCIHVDAGTNGSSRTVISEIASWVRSSGYKLETKPNSFAASSIADRLSK